MKFYIATSLSNYEQHNFVRDILIKRGHIITFDWTIDGPAWSKGIAALRGAAFSEIEGVREADRVVVIQKGERGTHSELGAALAFNIPTMIHFPSELENWAYGCKETCSFYHHPVVRFKSIGSIYTCAKNAITFLEDESL